MVAMKKSIAEQLNNSAVSASDIRVTKITIDGERRMRRVLFSLKTEEINEEYGEEVKAVIQPSIKVENYKELELELINYCRENLSNIKCPRSINFIEEFPRHETGKIFKRLIKEQYS